MSHSGRQGGLLHRVAHRSLWAVVVGATVAGTGGALFVSAFIARHFGVGAAIIAFVAAALPMPVYVMLALSIDRFEPEPPRLLCAMFVWGMSVASGVALLVNGALVELVRVIAAGRARDIVAVFAAPVVEEALKGIALLWLLWRHEDEIDGVLDGVVYSAMVALGFAFSENIIFYGVALAASPAELVQTLVVRGLYIPFSHPLFTAATGIGIALASRSRTQRRRRRAVALGLACAIALHAAWNAVATLAEAGHPELFGAVYLLFWVPLFASLLGVVRASQRRESAMIGRQLEQELSDLEIPAEERRAFVRLSGRWRLLASDLLRRDLRRWRSRRRLYRASGELAALRLRGHRHARADGRRERELVERLIEAGRVLFERRRQGVTSERCR